MTDYKKSTGSSGTMMIRDNGSTVSFMINSNNDSTFNNQLPWGYTVNGSTNNSRETRYSAGAGWVTLGSWTVTTDQTVTFRLFDTDTSGFGGPTTHSVAINRASAPDQPSKPVISEITSTTMRVRSTPGGNNGASIDGYQVARNTVNTTSGSGVGNWPDLDNVFAGLVPDTTYYFWARTHNAKGYSPWSVVAYATTIRVPDTPDPVIVSNPTQTTVIASFTEKGTGGSPIISRQLIYNTWNDVDSATTVPYTGVMTVVGLLPATTYYFWGRTRNSVGWSPYSPVVTRRTIAGAWINVNNVWKEAIPYVKVAGVWRVARPWVRKAGVWKETT